MILLLLKILGCVVISGAILLAALVVVCLLIGLYRSMKRKC